jgi:hypothetical protein
MDQIAAITHLSKRTVERMVKNGELPKRAIEGGRGKAHKWRWSLVRPALMELGFSGLPDRFPASRF